MVESPLRHVSLQKLRPFSNIESENITQFDSPEQIVHWFLVGCPWLVAPRNIPHRQNNEKDDLERLTEL